MPLKIGPNWIKEKKWELALFIAIGFCSVLLGAFVFPAYAGVLNVLAWIAGIALVGSLLSAFGIIDL